MIDPEEVQQHIERAEQIIQSLSPNQEELPGVREALKTEIRKIKRWIGKGYKQEVSTLKQQLMKARNSERLYMQKYIELLESSMKVRSS